MRGGDPRQKDPGGVYPAALPSALLFPWSCHIRLVSHICLWLKRKQEPESHISLQAQASLPKSSWKVPVQAVPEDSPTPRTINPLVPQDQALGVPHTWIYSPLPRSFKTSPAFQQLLQWHQWIMVKIIALILRLKSQITALKSATLSPCSAWIIPSSQALSKLSNIDWKSFLYLNTCACFGEYWSTEQSWGYVCPPLLSCCEKRFSETECSSIQFS